MSRKPRPRNATNATSPQDLFLAALREGLSIGGAAKQAKVNRATVYRWREADPEFATAWDEALEDGADALEDALTRRGLGFSDKAAMFMLGARRPEKYRQTTNVNLGGKVDHGVDDDAAKLIADLIAAGIASAAQAGG